MKKYLILFFTFSILTTTYFIEANTKQKNDIAVIKLNGYEIALRKNKVVYLKAPVEKIDNDYCQDFNKKTMRNMTNETHIILGDIQVNLKTQNYFCVKNKTENKEYVYIYRF